MNETLVIDALRTLHLVGLAGGFGLAIFSDITGCRGLRKPIEDEDVVMLERMHVCILVALGVLWASGFALFYLQTGLQPAGFTPKIMAKFAIVSCLTVLAIFVGRAVLPRYGLHVGKTFAQIWWPNRLIMSFAAGASLCCWVVALCLGTFTVIAEIDWNTLWRIVGFVFASGTSVAVLTGLVAPMLAPPAEDENEAHDPDKDIYYVSVQT